MKIKRTWKNLAVLVLVLPVRILLVLIPRTVGSVGDSAKRLGRWVDARLPRLDIDWSAEHARLRKEMFRLTDIRNRNA